MQHAPGSMGPGDGTAAEAPAGSQPLWANAHMPTQALVLEQLLGPAAPQQQQALNPLQQVALQALQAQHQLRNDGAAGGQALGTQLAGGVSAPGPGPEAALQALQQLQRAPAGQAASDQLLPQLLAQQQASQQASQQDKGTAAGTGTMQSVLEPYAAALQRALQAQQQLLATHGPSGLDALSREDSKALFSGDRLPSLDLSALFTAGSIGDGGLSVATSAPPARQQQQQQQQPDAQPASKPLPTALDIAALGNGTDQAGTSGFAAAAAAAEHAAQEGSAQSPEALVWNSTKARAQPSRRPSQAWHTLSNVLGDAGEEAHAAARRGSTTGGAQSMEGVEEEGGAEGTDKKRHRQRSNGDEDEEWQPEKGAKRGRSTARQPKSTKGQGADSDTASDADMDEAAHAAAAARRVRRGGSEEHADSDIADILLTMAESSKGAGNAVAAGGNVEDDARTGNSADRSALAAKRKAAAAAAAAAANAGSGGAVSGDAGDGLSDGGSGGGNGGGNGSSGGRGGRRRYRRPEEVGRSAAERLRLEAAVQRLKRAQTGPRPWPVAGEGGPAGQDEAVAAAGEAQEGAEGAGAAATAGVTAGSGQEGAAAAGGTSSSMPVTGIPSLNGGLGVSGPGIKLEGGVGLEGSGTSSGLGQLANDTAAAFAALPPHLLAQLGALGAGTSMPPLSAPPLSLSPGPSGPSLMGPGPLDLSSLGSAAPSATDQTQLQLQIQQLLHIQQLQQLNMLQLPNNAGIPGSLGMGLPLLGGGPPAAQLPQLPQQQQQQQQQVAQQHAHEEPPEQKQHLIRRHGALPERVITRDMLREVFPLPIEEAAKSLGIGQTMLKHYCRKFGIPRWPYRKRQSVVILIQSIEEFAKERPLTVQPALNKLRSFLAQIDEDPNVDLDSPIKRLRQAFFKEAYKARVRHAQGDAGAPDADRSIRATRNMQRTGQWLENLCAAICNERAGPEVPQSLGGGEAGGPLVLAPPVGSVLPPVLGLQALSPLADVLQQHQQDQQNQQNQQGQQQELGGEGQRQQDFKPLQGVGGGLGALGQLTLEQLQQLQAIQNSLQQNSLQQSALQNSFQGLQQGAPALQGLGSLSGLQGLQSLLPLPSLQPGPLQSLPPVQSLNEWLQASAPAPVPTSAGLLQPMDGQQGSAGQQSLPSLPLPPLNELLQMAGQQSLPPLPALQTSNDAFQGTSQPSLPPLQPLNELLQSMGHQSLNLLQPASEAAQLTGSQPLAHLQLPNEVSHAANDQQMLPPLPPLQLPNMPANMPVNLAVLSALGASAGPVSMP